MSWWQHFLVLGGIALGAANDWRADAEALEREGRLDRAITSVERHLDALPDDAEAWRWLAGAFERLAGAEGGSMLLHADAAAAWDRAAQLLPDDDEALLAAANARLRAGELAAAEERATRALGLQLDRDGKAADGTVGLVLRARTGAFARREHVDRVAFSRDVLELRRGIEEIRVVAARNAEVAVAEARWLASIELSDLAIRKLLDALAGEPSSIALHRAVVDLHLGVGIEERLPRVYEALVAAHPGDAIVRWYAGYVARLAGDLAARERRNEDAAEHYAHCTERMREAATLDPAYGESALWVEMQARVGAGWSALDADDVERAEEEWATVMEEWPEFAERVDGLGRTPAQGLGRLGGRYHVRDRLLDARRVSHKVAEATQQAWSWNNVAYLLREIASDTEISGEDGSFDAARSVFVESWNTYRRAADLAPHEPRIINDTALIQIYHLREDLEGAERMLHRAIQVGEALLEEMGPNPEESERFPIAQAVGDAYQNLGFLHYRLLDDPVKARDYLVRSLETDSGVRREVAASIRAIDAGRGLEGLPPPVRDEPPAGGTEDPVADRGEGTPPDPAPEGAGAEKPEGLDDAPLPRITEGTTAPPETVPDVDWERSIDVALEAATTGERPVLVYHRVGGGIGPSVEYLQRHLHSASFARATAGAITLLADGLRHTFTDRRRDGRLVLCPRSGGLTCAEHLACGHDFERRWYAGGGEVLGLRSNGLYRVTAEGLSRVSPMEDTFERYRPDGGRLPDRGAPSGSAEVEPSRGAPLPTEVEGLVRSRRLAARRALEELIFETGTADQRLHAVAFLGEYPGADNDELLAVLARQHADPFLATVALHAWREDLGTEVPRFALQTSTSPATRAAAISALARIGDETAEHVLVARWLLAAESITDASAVERLATMDLGEIAAEIGSR